MWKLIGGLVALALGAMQANAQSGAQATARSAPSGKSATVSVNTSGSGLTIPSNFVGLSGEVGDLVGHGYYQGNTGANLSFINVVKLLGANGVLRLGGGTSDTVTPPALTQNIANNLNTFVTALGAGWTIIYGLDLFANNSATAATQAGFIATAFGASNSTFQFGNEPDGYYNIATYQTNWNLYYTAVTGAVSGAKYAAWDASSFCCDVTVANGLTPGMSGLAWITNHYYVSQITPNPTLAQVVNDPILNNANQGTNSFNQLVNTVTAGGSKLRLSESNCVTAAQVQVAICAQLSGATWFLNTAIALASGGWAGMNMHGSYFQLAQPAPYDPIVLQGDGNFGAGPIFYGMYLFAQIEGQQILPSSVGGNASVTAIATLRTASKANIIVVNNDINGPVTVTPQQSAAWSTANVLKVAGSGCTELNPTLGGKAIGESGVWSGTTFSINSGQSITLGPCEAALVSVQ